jgi:Fic-DOC domain mobile mystery protein B
VEEQEQLIPSLSTRHELNEFERLNILRANQWLFRPRRLSSIPRLHEADLRELHRRMFDRTWRWAGRYRTSDRNIGISHYLIRESIPSLVQDLHFWIQNGIYPPDELAVRFHHRLVYIHPFPNGNGRHARLLADALIVALGARVFTWGSASNGPLAEARSQYIAALRAADKNDLAPLLDFVRS